jgi:uncharacterized protein with FMN-binding domain
MRRAVVALLVTAVAVVLVARYETHPPVTLTERTIPPAPPPRTVPGQRTADGPAMTTPFSVIQVQATLTHGRLTGVKTISMSGDGPHTKALNARAEPILRAEALKAGSADIDVVTGATSSSTIWIDSLRGAIRKARRGG